MRVPAPLLPVVAAVVTLLLGKTGLLGALDLYTYDRRLALRQDGGWPADLVMVPLDDAAFQEHGRWPWDRAKVARLVDELRALGAKTILFDLTAASLTNPESDRELSRALTGTILPVGFTAHDIDARTGLEILKSVAMVPAPPPDGVLPIAANRLLAPRPEFAGVAGGLGHVVARNSSDLGVRSVEPLIGVETLEGSLPVIGLLALLRQRGLDPRALRHDARALVLPDGTRVPMDEGIVFLDMVPGGVPPDHVRAVEILDVNADRERLRARVEGKLAVLHLDSLVHEDMFPTPVALKTPGGLVQAYVVRTFAGGRAPRPLSPWLVPLVSLVAALVLAERLARRPPAILLGAGAAAALAVSVAALIAAWAADLFFNFVAPATFFLVAGGLLATHSSFATERERRRLQALLKASYAGAGASPDPGARADAGEEAGDAGEAATDAPTTATPPPLRERMPDRTQDFGAGARDTGPQKPTGTSALLLAGTALAQPVEVGRYLVERALGKGGMGAIFLGRDRDLDRVVAIKVLEASDKGAYLRFRREALAVARIVHPNVVQIFEVGFDAEAPYIVMEYVPGGTVADMLREPGPTPPPWIRSTKVIRGIARGLGAAHEKGIVHRDVKPSNLLLVAKGADDAKIADFGIAKLSGADSLTREGSFVGTVGYLSPEQAMGLAVDARSDVYSLGVTWYRMLTGRPAFDGTTAQILRASVQQSVPDPRRMNPSLPEPLARLLLEMTALDRADRPRDCVEVAKRMDVILEDLRVTGASAG